jgi:hypothetical protein
MLFLSDDSGIELDTASLSAQVKSVTGACSVYCVRKSCDLFTLIYLRYLDLLDVIVWPRAPS